MPDLCEITGNLVAVDGSIPSDPVLKVTRLVKNGVAISTADKTFAYDPETGTLALSLLRDSVATLKGNVEGFSGPNGATIAIPDKAEEQLESLLASSFPTSSITHLVPVGSTPTIVAGSGAGVGASANIAGSDVAGQVTVNTAGTPAALAAIATITFNVPYSDAPYAVLTPSNSTAAILEGDGGSRKPYVETTATTLIIKSSNPLASGATYKWNYLVIG